MCQQTQETSMNTAYEGLTAQTESKLNKNCRYEKGGEVVCVCVGMGWGWRSWGELAQMSI